VSVNINRLKGVIREHGRTYEYVAKHIGINRDTFTRRMQSNGADFTIYEVYQMMKIIPLSLADVVTIFFDNKKAG
jgi:hypothetical protein